MPVSYYAILGVKRDASSEDVHRAYRRLAGICHPDKTGGVRMLFDLIQEAHDELMDIAKRKRYDSFLQYLNEQHSDWKKGGPNGAHKKSNRREEYNAKDNQKEEMLNPRERCEICGGFGRLFVKVSNQKELCGWCDGTGWVRRKF